MSKSIKCFHCKGWCYLEYGDIWCLMCGRWQVPPTFKPLPYVATTEDKFDENSWFIDDNGDIIDIIDQKIEELIKNSASATFNVSYVAKAVHCSNYEARMTLDRLVRIGQLEQYRYGPMSRWIGYRRI